ncbi:hypothetical protein HZB94_00425 [Candidatus Falkowbacteria bacterium]|nr:hypothetical protein [Candidatus Falkowbacteria bacterium]
MNKKQTNRGVARFEALMKALDEGEEKYKSTKKKAVPAGGKLEASPKEKNDDLSGVLWKMRGKSGLNYNFHGFSAMERWISNMKDAPKALVSIDEGKTWKRWSSFMTFKRRGLSVADAFAKTRAVKVRS